MHEDIGMVFDDQQNQISTKPTDVPLFFIVMRVLFTFRLFNRPSLNNFMRVTLGSDDES